MTIDEAIKVLDDYNPEEEQNNYQKIWQALNLAIEVMKREQDWRQRFPQQSHLPFPGETEK